MVFTAQRRLIPAKGTECLPINASDILVCNDPFATGQVLGLMCPPFLCLLSMARCLCGEKGHAQTREVRTFPCTKSALHCSVKGDNASSSLMNGTSEIPQEQQAFHS